MDIHVPDDYACIPTQPNPGRGSQAAEVSSHVSSVYIGNCSLSCTVYCPFFRKGAMASKHNGHKAYTVLHHRGTE